MEKLEIDNVTELDNWHQIDWNKVNAKVRSLRERIFVASKKDNLKQVSNLQKLMLRSRSNWLQSIRRITQLNKGRWTPGIDKEIYSTPEKRLELFHWLNSIASNQWVPPPVRRVYIAKDVKRKRPLGIPIYRSYCTSCKRSLGM